MGMFKSITAVLNYDYVKMTKMMAQQERVNVGYRSVQD